MRHLILDHFEIPIRPRSPNIDFKFGSVDPREKKAPGLNLPPPPSIFFFTRERARKIGRVLIHHRRHRRRQATKLIRLEIWILR